MTFQLDTQIKNEMVVVLLPTFGYKRKLVEIANYLAENYKSIFYINVNRNFSSLHRKMRRAEVPLEKFLFIDLYLKKNNGKKHSNYISITNPNSLKKLLLIIKKSIKKGTFSALFFDSISSLLKRNDPENVTRFIHDLFNILRPAGILCIFTIKRKSNPSVAADIKMFTDYVIWGGD